VSFFEKLAILPKPDQDRWEQRLLKHYTLQEASALLDYVIEADSRLPSVFEPVLACCEELIVARFPEVLDKLHVSQIDIGAHFLQWLVDDFGMRFRVGRHMALLYEDSCLWRMDDRLSWISQTRTALEQSPFMTLDSLLELLDLNGILYHHVALGVFNKIFDEVGIHSYYVSATGSVTVDQIVANPTVIQVIEHEGPPPYFMDHYFKVYEDPSVRISNQWDALYFSPSSLLPLLQMLAVQMHAANLHDLELQGIGKFLVEKCATKYSKAPLLLDSFMKNVMHATWHTVANQAAGSEIDGILAAAGLASAPGRITLV
jgi:hypothetical protein